MVISIYYSVGIYSQSQGYMTFRFDNLQQVKQFLSKYNATSGGTFRIKIFKNTTTIDNNGNITTTQTNVTSW